MNPNTLFTCEFVASLSFLFLFPPLNLGAHSSCSLDRGGRRRERTDGRSVESPLAGCPFSSSPDRTQCSPPPSSVSESIATPSRISSCAFVRFFPFSSFPFNHTCARVKISEGGLGWLPGEGEGYRLNFFFSQNLECERGGGAI